MVEAVPVIAIDGPSGSGKGTVSRAIAQHLGWHLLDSGALYRLVALAAMDEGLQPDNADDVIRGAELARTLDVQFVSDPAGVPLVLLAGTDATRSMRSQACSDNASRWAGLPQIRQALMQRQKDFRRAPGLVADGRDMGTTIFPEATLKVFLWASARERARRRHAQLAEMGQSEAFEKIHAEVQERDRRDTTRAHSPLSPAADARRLDTTDMPPRQVVETILSWLPA